MSEKQWTKIEPYDDAVWNSKGNLEEGDSLEGAYIGAQANVGPNESNMYSIRKDDGEIVKFWGSVLLDTRMPRLQIGSDVKIVYTGSAINPKSKRTYQTYEVFGVENLPSKKDKPLKKIKDEDIPVAEEGTDEDEINVKDIPF